jgi:hypothetical protein
MAAENGEGSVKNAPQCVRKGLQDLAGQGAAPW